MAIEAGETTFYQAKRGIVQDGLVLNLDADVGDNTNSTWQNLTGGTNTTLSNFGGFSKTNNGFILDFDGSDDVGTIADSNDDYLFLSSPFTISAFVNVVTMSQGTTLRIIGKPEHHNTMAGPIWWLQVYGAGSGGVNPQLLSNGVSASAGSFSYNVWLHCVSTNSGGGGGTTKIYQNGSLLATGTTSFGEQEETGRPLIFGDSYGWGVSNFSIGCMQIYNKELTAAEVSRNFNATRHRFGV